jgi:alkaline phosphatase
MKIKPILVLTTAVGAIGLSGATLGSPQSYPAPASDATFWYNLAAGEVVVAQAQSRQDAPVKNVIFFVGDGRGITTVTAARIL